MRKLLIPIAALALLGSVARSADISNLYPPGQYPGIGTNTAASVGNIGELITATLASGSAVSLVNATAKTVTSISLTAGEWDVTGVIVYAVGALTTVQELDCNTSLTTNTVDATVGALTTIVYPSPAAVLTQPTDPIIACAPRRFSFNATTSVFLIAFSGFSVSTNTAYGFIRATRIH